MGRKAKKNGTPNVPNYERLNTIEAVEEQISIAKDAVCRKVKLQLSIKEAKKEADAAYNEQLKELAEEIDTEIVVLSGWEGRKMQIAAGPDNTITSTVTAQNSVTIPMPVTPFRPPAS